MANLFSLRRMRRQLWKKGKDIFLGLVHIIGKATDFLPPLPMVAPFELSPLGMAFMCVFHCSREDNQLEFS